MNKRNATASWSGYLHQGKVGVLVGLREINRLLESEHDLTGWFIEFESAEDIDIKYHGKVVSRHQVKANKDKKYPNDYKDVLSEQTFKIKDGKKTIDTPGFQVCNPETGEIEVDDDSRYLHTIKEVKGFGLDKKNFNIQFPDSTYVSNVNNIKLYTYPDGNKHCDLSRYEEDKILNFCKNEIKSILSRIEHHPFKNKDGEHKSIFKHLLHLLDIQIREKHMKGSSYFPTLTFQGIYEAVIDQEEYRQGIMEIMRERFGQAWTDFIQETQGVYNYKDEQIKNVNQIIEELYKFDDKEFIQFIKDINPDVNKAGNLSTIDDVFELFSVDSFKDIFYECLVNVTEEDFDLDYRGYQGKNKDDSYLLTLINRPKSKTGIVVTNMTMNKGVTHEIFNRRYLINGQINAVRFGDYIQQNSDITTPETNWPHLVTKNEIFYNPSLEFINVENAIEQLNKKGGSS